MAEILGLGVTDMPFMRRKHTAISGVVQHLIVQGWEKHLQYRDPKNWPKPVQQEWGTDQAATVAKAVQDRQIQLFRRLKQELDSFGPDFIVMIHRDIHETWENYGRPRYWISAHEKVQMKLWHEVPIAGIKGNYFDEDPERVDTLLGHREAALYLIRHLLDMGFNPAYLMEPVHLDWDKREYKTPIVPFAVDPFGFNRFRSTESLSEWDKSQPRPLNPQEAFALGRAMARILRSSPWRVALVAGVNWSHLNDSAGSLGRIHPDVEADNKRFEEWKNHLWVRWEDEGNWTYEEMEDHAQWELLVTFILCGAMKELGSRITFTESAFHWPFNDDLCTTIFEVR